MKSSLLEKHLIGVILIICFISFDLVSAFVPKEILYHADLFHMQQQQHSVLQKSKTLRYNELFKVPHQDRKHLLFSSSSADSFEQANSETSKTSPEQNRDQIVILGGGFGGLNAALNLASLPWNEIDHDSDEPKCRPRIQLIDRKERFIFLPLLYELCVGDADLEEVAPTFESLLKGVDVEFVQAEVKGVDAENNIVYLDSFLSESATESDEHHRRIPTVEGPACIKYDALVVSTGMESNLAAVPGANDLALPFYTVEDCFELRKRLTLIENSNEKDKPVEAVVIGGGYSGVELAMNLMEKLGGKDKARVTLVHRGNTILEGASDFNRKTSISRLEKSGVQILTNTSVEKIDPLPEHLASGKHDSLVHIRSKDADAERTLSANILLWAAGAKPPPNTGALNSIFPRDKSNRIVTNDLLRVRNSENVFCIGDASRGRKDPYPVTAQVAMQQAPVVAWNIFATLKNRRNSKDARRRNEEEKLLAFKYLDLGNMMTLGRNDAAITSLGGLVQLEGSAASIARRLIYAVRMPTVNQAATAAILSTSQRVSKALADGLVKKDMKTKTK